MLQQSTITLAAATAALLLAGCAGTSGDPDVPDPGYAAPVIQVSPNEGTVSSDVEVMVNGFPPGERVEIGFGPPASEYEVLTHGFADPEGTLTLVVEVPTWADTGREYVFVADSNGPGEAAVSDPFMVRRTDGADMVHLTGVLTDEGVECPALRSDQGGLYTLAGETGRFDTGDRVEVHGTVAEMSICMQGTTISVEDIGNAR